MVKNEKSICFVSRSVHYFLLSNGHNRVGGAEVQQKILADELVCKGWKVSFVTEKLGKKKEICLSPNMVVFFALDFKSGNKYLTKIFSLPFNLWKILKQIDADVYYQRDPNYLSGIIALFCRVNRKCFILAGANDWNFDKGNEQNLNNIADRFSAGFAMRLADKIIVQNNRQKELLRRNHKREGTIFYNIFYARELRTKARHIFWAARIESYKRPKLFLELAGALPEYDFVMVGGKGMDSSLEVEIEKQATTLENLSYLGHQPFERVEELFNETAIFVNTSIPGCEGFPNTFLQAWSRGIPVISFFDIDGLISNNSLGIVAESLPHMKKAVESLLTKTKASVADSRRIQKFFLRKFSVASQLSSFVQILRK